MFVFSNSLSNDSDTYLGFSSSCSVEFILVLSTSPPSSSCEEVLSLDSLCLEDDWVEAFWKGLKMSNIDIRIDIILEPCIRDERVCTQWPSWVEMSSFISILVSLNILGSKSPLIHLNIIFSKCSMSPILGYIQIVRCLYRVSYSLIESRCYTHGRYLLYLHETKGISQGWTGLNERQPIEDYAFTLYPP